MLCVGGATVDHSYRLDGPIVLGSSNPAVGRRSFGGVARNVAENLARRGVTVDLVSRVGDDETGRALCAALDAVGVGRRGVDQVAGGATADYLAVLTPEGELALGVAATAVLDGLTPDALERHRAAVAAADWVFADCNLPAATLAALALHRPPGACRLAADAVSVAKSARLPERLDGFDLLFANRDEAAAMAARAGLSDGSPEAVAAHLIGVGAGAVVLTLGPAGALAASPAGIRHVPAVPARVVDVTGAGDALIAGTLAALMDGAGLAAAVAFGCAAAARAVETDAATPPRRVNPTTRSGS